MWTLLQEPELKSSAIHIERLVCVSDFLVFGFFPSGQFYFHFIMMHLTFWWIPISVKASNVFCRIILFWLAFWSALLDSVSLSALQISPSVLICEDLSWTFLFTLQLLPNDFVHSCGFNHSAHFYSYASQLHISNINDLLNFKLYTQFPVYNHILTVYRYFRLYISKKKFTICIPSLWLPPAFLFQFVFSPIHSAT